MSEPFSWRGLTFQWDAAQSRYVCGRWSLGRPRGEWCGFWNTDTLYLRGKSSESRSGAMDNLCDDLAEAFANHRRKAQELIGSDLDSLTQGDPHEQAPKAAPQAL